MKNKGLSVLLSFVLVLVLTVFFSVPVKAVGSSFNRIWSCDAFSFTSSNVYVSNGDVLMTDPWDLDITGNSGVITFRIPLKLNQLGITGDIVSRGDAVQFIFKGQQLVLNGIRNNSTSSDNNDPDGYILYANLVIEDNIYPMPYNSSQWRTITYEYNTSSLSIHDLLYLDVAVYFECQPDSKDFLQYGNLSVTFKCNGLEIYNGDYIGSSGDIKGQTDTLTSGFDSSSMSSSNTALSGSIAEYTGTESQITDQSVSFIDGVQFYDLQTKPQMLACVTFCSSWLQSLFVNIGDWGILVMVSLSFGFGLMLIGWFKYRRK